MIDRDGRRYFYNKQGVTRDLNPEFNFVVLPDFQTPDWAKGAVMYQIYVDRFYNGDPSNDVVTNEYAYLGTRAKHIDDWNAPLENMDVCNFYGGDLQGVIDKMGYLKDLGIDVIYFNPIFVSPSNHKYDIQDYDNVDPHYGVIINDGGKPLEDGTSDNTYAEMYVTRVTDKENLEASNALMIKLIEIAHQNGIRIILDGVFNHCGAFNKWLDREGFYKNGDYPIGAYWSEKSEYHDFFMWHENHWPCNTSYDSWWGHSNHPKLNFEGSEELCNYILGVGKKWVSPPFNADGWRLDVAADLGFSKKFNMQFWRRFRTAVKTANPDAIILAEHYGDPKDWLMGDQWDTVMNYDAFMEPLTWFLTGVEKHSESTDGQKYNNSGAFEASMRYFMSRFSYQSLTVSMNQLSNHDHSRFLTRTSGKTGRLHTNGAQDADTGVNKGVMKEAIAFQMTWVGAPTIYYGDEAGMTGWTDPDNRRTYPWGHEDMEIMDFYKAMIRVHKKYPCLSTGSTSYLFMDYGLMCYARWDKKNKIAVVINNNDCDKEVVVPMWRTECNDGDIIERVISSDMSAFTEEIERFKVKEGCIVVKVPPFSSNVYVRKERVIYNDFETEAETGSEGE
jgi:alpha-glucosidase